VGPLIVGWGIVGVRGDKAGFSGINCFFAGGKRALAPGKQACWGPRAGPPPISQ